MRQTYTVYGLLARAVQHELEHLDGGVFIDNVEDKTKITAKLEKLEAKTKRALGIA
jgi:peptide deformylase